MKKFFAFIYFLSIAFYADLYAQHAVDRSEWELIFEDEFDSVHAHPYIIDSQKWSRFFSYPQSGTPLTCNCRKDQETGKFLCDTLGKTYFTQWNELPGSNLQIDTSGSGTLSIIAQKQDYTAVVTSYYSCGSPECDPRRKCFWNAVKKDSICTDHDTVAFNYTTAMLYSKQKFRYGFFELRFKIPPLPVPPATHSGFTMDWWMWDRQGLESNEIDMFEIRGKDNQYTNNVHYKRDQQGTDLAGKTYYHPEALSPGWHISALDWGPDRLDFYLDGIKIRSYPFHPDKMIPMPMIIDMVPNAVNFCNGVEPNTVFPFVFEVDYVRVYRRK